MRTLLLLSLICLTHIVPAQKLSREAVKADLQLVYKELKTYNPGLYILASKEAYEARLDSLIQSLPEEIPYLEAYQKLVYFLTLTNEAHVQIDWPFDQLASTPTFFPFYVYVKGEEAFITHNFSDQDFSGYGLPNEGVQILSINGEPIV
ncbi:MAG: hypothetical protein AAF206_30800, partial [Bacteroidota bacterium]